MDTLTKLLICLSLMVSFAVFYNEAADGSSYVILQGPKQGQKVSVNADETAGTLSDGTPVKINCPIGVALPNTAASNYAGYYINSVHADCYVFT